MVAETPPRPLGVDVLRHPAEDLAEHHRPEPPGHDLAQVVGADLRDRPRHVDGVQGRRVDRGSIGAGDPEDPAHRQGQQCVPVHAEAAAEQQQRRVGLAGDQPQQPQRAQPDDDVGGAGQHARPIDQLDPAVAEPQPVGLERPAAEPEREVDEASDVAQPVGVGELRHPGQQRDHRSAAYGRVLGQAPDGVVGRGRRQLDELLGRQVDQEGPDRRLVASGEKTGEVGHDIPSSATGAGWGQIVRGDAG